MGGVGVGLAPVAEAPVADAPRLPKGLREGGVGGMAPRAGRGLVLEGPAVGAERRAAGGQEDEIGGNRLHALSGGRAPEDNHFGPLRRPSMTLGTAKPRRISGAGTVSNNSRKAAPLVRQRLGVDIGPFWSIISR